MFILFFLLFFNKFFQFSSEKIDENYTIFPSLPVSVLKSNNKLCQQHSDIYLANLQNLTLWAHEMWDSTAKSTIGVLTGNVYQMGNFDECLSVQAPFNVQYCLVNIEINVPSPTIHKDFRSLTHDPYESVAERLYVSGDVSQQARNSVVLGWCIPASCTTNDSEIFLNDYVDNINLPLLNLNDTKILIKIPQNLCQIKGETNNFTNIDSFFIILSIILIILVIISTLYEFKLEHNDKIKKYNFMENLFLSFSAKKNFLDLKKSDESNDGALKILYGVRTLCILMIILDHRFGTFLSSALLNFDFVEREYRSPFAFLFFHGDLFVDSFFLLSGLLVTYTLLNQFDKRFMNPIFIILLRYIRLTPIYAFVIFFYATLLPHIGNGPLWNQIVGQESQDCKDNWWLNMLYINNYVNSKHMCMPQTWYLPCDFHYFIIGIIICIILNKNKKIGLSLLSLLLIISLIIPFVITIIYMRPALLFFYTDFLRSPKTHIDFILTYIKSHTRASPYLVGIFAGYLYYRLKEKNNHICKIKSCIILIASITLIIISLASGAIFYNPYYKYNAIESALYAASHRIIFTCGSVGILYVTSYGHASVLYKILTWTPWIPLSKLTYGAYLIHMVFQYRAIGNLRIPQVTSYFTIISLGLSDIVLSFIMALCLYLLVESPFRRVFKQILMPSNNRIKKQDIIEPTNTFESSIIINNGRNFESRL